MAYEKKVKIRVVYGFAIALLGLAAFIIGVFFRSSHLHDFLAGFYSGTGGALLCVGLVTAIWNIILASNEEKRSKVEIQEKDERNLFINTRTGYLSFYITLYLLYVGSLVAGFLNLAVFITLLSVTALMVVVMLIVYFVYRHIY